MIYQELEQGFINYATQKIGKERTNKLIDHQPNTIEKGINAASILASQYDIGIGIATDGLWFSYLFSQYGLPTIIVDMKRRLNGATWEEIDPIREEQIRNKRVIIFDNDVITGRTIRRAVKELSKFHPQKIDLLLSVYNIYMNITHYRRYEKFLKGEPKGEENDGKYRYFILDINNQIPKEIRKVFALEKDFGIKNLEEILSEPSFNEHYQNQAVLLGKH